MFERIKSTRQQINALCRKHPQFRVIDSYKCYPNEKVAFIMNLQTSKIIYVHTYPDDERCPFLIRTAEGINDYVGGHNYYPKTEDEYFEIAMRLTK